MKVKIFSKYHHNTPTNLEKVHLKDDEVIITAMEYMKDALKIFDRERLRYSPFLGKSAGGQDNLWIKVKIGSQEEIFSNKLVP